jgi:hypothetical protein
VVLFGPVSPALWGPPLRAGEHGALHAVLWHGDGSGDPWGTELDPALAAITVDEVLAAVPRELSVPEAPADGGAFGTESS